MSDGQPAPNPALVYEEYFVPAMFERWVPLLLERGTPQAGEAVLDVACGTGVVARAVAPRVGSEGRVVGLDMSGPMLEVARSLPDPDGAPIEWVQADATELPEGPFDLVLCQQGLQFVPDPVEALRAMRQVMASDGRAVITVWRDLPSHTVFDALCRSEARHLDADIELLARPFLFGDADRLQRVCDEAGLRSVEVSEETVEARYVSPDRFVTLFVLGAAAVLPQLAELDDDGRAELVAQVKQDIEPVLEAHTEGDEVVFPTHAHVITARR
jgi:SAM-dependent methyltransferase